MVSIRSNNDILSFRLCLAHLHACSSNDIFRLTQSLLKWYYSAVVQHQLYDKKFVFIIIWYKLICIFCLCCIDCFTNCHVIWKTVIIWTSSVENEINLPNRPERPSASPISFQELRNILQCHSLRFQPKAF